MKTKQLLQQVNKSTFIQDYLTACGIDDVQEYLDPTGKYVDEPMGYEGMNEGLELIKESLSEQPNCIYIIQDCDVDGICSATLMYRFLVHVGVQEKDIRVLFHEDKKHGLSPDIMMQIEDDMYECEFDKNPLIIIPDAGTNDTKQCDHFAELGCKILILDHHDKEKDNPYAVVINNQTSPNVSNKSLSGTGVVWKFITAYCKKYLGDHFYISLIDLVHFANLADVMDMRSYENRTIEQWFKVQNPFFDGLCQVFGKGLNKTEPEGLVWNVVPKLNAVCRSDNAKLKKDVFYAFTKDLDPQNNKEMGDVISSINSTYNRQRRIVNELYGSIRDNHKVSDNNIEIILTTSTPYTGLIANKLMDYYRKPVLLVHRRDKTLTGSVRSPYPLKSIINDSKLALFCQGHEQACGISFYESDATKLIEYCNNIEVPEVEVTVCHSYKPQDIQHDIFGIFDEWRGLYATNVSYPTFYIAPIYINNTDIKLLGKTGTTVKFTYQGVEYLKFFTTEAEREQLFVDVFNSKRQVPLEIEVVGKMRLNTWAGKTIEQVEIVQFECKEKEQTFDSIW